MAFNFVGPKYDEPFDRDLFLDDDVLEQLPEGMTTMAQLLAHIGKFKSIGEAKKNGWDKPIPTGWNEFNIGKGKNRIDIFIWNPTTTLQEFIDQMID